MNTTKNDTDTETKETFLALYKTIKRLRAPGGCPWDIEQSPETLRGALIEECYECIDAINSKDASHIMEELGDVFLVITMLAYMYEQAGEFSLASVLKTVNEKLIRRHPHVFGNVSVSNSDEVIQNWDKIKREKEGRARASVLDEVPRSVPPLFRAFKLQKKAAKAGFDWENADGVFDKVQEEINELREAIKTKDGGKIEEEAGDVLFSVINLARFIKTDPSVVLQKANNKFYNRFVFVENAMKERGLAMSKENTAAMEECWQQAKAAGEA